MIEKKIKARKDVIKGIFSLMMISFFVFLCMGAVSEAGQALTPDNYQSARAKKAIGINNNFKSVIEENQSLYKINENLKQELDAARADRDRLTKNIETVQTANRTYSKAIHRLENEQTTPSTMKVARASKRTKRSSIATSSKEEAQSEGVVDIIAREDKTIDLLATIDAFTEPDQRLKLDAAKAHYNMGNIYFQKGQYEIAAREYYQAISLMPDDPDAHYNLAFVSSEFLADFRTALKHYQMYMYLKPKAKDRLFIKEKIIEAKFVLKNEVDSPLEDK